MTRVKTVSRVSAPLGEVDVGRQRSRFARWRMGTLILVYVLMTAHVVHWLVAGKTLAPLELNEVMYTLELGIVTAGFLFMVVAMIATLIFGRFFCSWGCHILALQDLCSWALEKLGIRPKAIRSRALFWVPIVAAAYMFAWPQVVRLWDGRALPILHVRTDGQGWASFMTENYWRNLPGPGVAILTFGVVGFLIVYVLGSRSFCAYGCPYGAVFGLLDRLAPGRIRLKSGKSCEDCGICTAVCSSHVRVHEEIARHAMIINPRCLKDLDCIAACPDKALYFGFGRPSLFKRTVSQTPIDRRYDFTWSEEFIIVVVMVVTLLTFRGLYDRVPFLMSLGLGAIVAYSAVVASRLVRLPEVKFQRMKLKAAHRLRPAGWAFVTLMGLFASFTIHCAFVHYQTWSGRRDFNVALSGTDLNYEAVDRALRHLKSANLWGLFCMPENDRMIGELLVRTDRWVDAETIYRSLMTRDSGNQEARLRLAKALTKQNNPEEANRILQEGMALAGRNPKLLYELAGSFHTLGRIENAIAALNDAVRVQPDFARAHCDLGVCLLELSEIRGALQHLTRAVELEPSHSDAHYNLALALWMTQSFDDARREINWAYELNPADEQTKQLRDLMFEGQQP